MNLDQYESLWSRPPPLFCFSNRVKGATVDHDKVAPCSILSTARCGQQVPHKTSWAVTQTSFASAHDKARESVWISKTLHSPLLPAHDNLTFVLFCRGENKQKKKMLLLCGCTCPLDAVVDYRWSHNCRESQTNQISRMQRGNRGRKPTMST